MPKCGWSFINRKKKTVNSLFLQLMQSNEHQNEAEKNLLTNQTCTWLLGGSPGGGL